MIPPTNTLLGSSISRILPKDTAKNLAKDVFRYVRLSLDKFHMPATLALIPIQVLSDDWYGIVPDDTEIKTTVKGSLSGLSIHTPTMWMWLE